MGGTAIAIGVGLIAIIGLFGVGLALRGVRPKVGFAQRTPLQQDVWNYGAVRADPFRDPANVQYNPFTNLEMYTPGGQIVHDSSRGPHHMGPSWGG